MSVWLVRGLLVLTLPVGLVLYLALLIRLFGQAAGF